MEGRRTVFGGGSEAVDPVPLVAEQEHLELFDHEVQLDAEGHEGEEVWSLLRCPVVQKVCRSGSRVRW